MSDINKLTVKIYDDSGAAFTDITEAMHEFGRDSKTINLDTSDLIYLGREKPFSAVYVEMGSIVNSAASLLTAEYYDTSAAAWTALPLLVNEPEVGGVALSRSGFLKWDKGIDTDDWGEVAIDSKTQYWIRLTASADLTDTMAVKAINILFSSDEDLKRYHPSILSFLPRDENDTVEASFIRAHEAARDKVMLELNRGGLTKADATDGHIEPLDAWDVHNVNHVNLASTFAALEVLFFDLTDTEGDQYDFKRKEYSTMYKNAMAGVVIELDRNDDGFVDSDEQGKTLGTTLIR